MQLQDTVVMQYYEARLWAENDQSKHLGAQLSCASTWQEYLPLYGRTDFKILFLILTIVDVKLNLRRSKVSAVNFAQLPYTVFLK